MMTKIEIYKRALDGLWYLVDRFKHLCAKRYGKPNYAETERKLFEYQEKYRWLEKEILRLVEEEKANG